MRDPDRGRVDRRDHSVLIGRAVLQRDVIRAREGRQRAENQEDVFHCCRFRLMERSAVRHERLAEALIECPADFDTGPYAETSDSTCDNYSRRTEPAGAG